MGLFDNLGGGNSLWEILSPKPSGLMPRSPRLTLDPDKLKRRLTPRRCFEPAPGTPVYCDLAVVAEHTGIYIGDNEIVHLNGDGNIEIVSPREFVARLDGVNPAISIRYAAKDDGKPLCRKSIADRAKAKVGGSRNYQFVFDNCHQFTCGCISGDFENACNFFWMVETEITDKLGAFTWMNWDY